MRIPGGRLGRLSAEIALLLLAYVERNPVRAQLPACAEDYEWSSARPRLQGRADLVDLTPWQAKYDGPRWQEALRSSIDEEAFGQRLREVSRRGRPLGKRSLWKV